MLYPSELQALTKDYYSFTTIRQRGSFSARSRPL